MDLQEFDAWCRSFLEIDGLAGIDDSLNGIQAGRSDGPVTKVAFAVDACLEAMRRSRDAGAQVLFVHHGMFWGKPGRLVGSTLERIRFLLENDIALYACHLPLDRHPVVGNNAVLCRALGLERLEPFGTFHGIPLGFKGSFPEPVPLDEAVRRVLPDGSPPLSLLAFGPGVVRTAGVISGGAAFESLQAIEQGLELYVTGETTHSIYRLVEEAGINVLCAGHYATEVHGVRAVAEKLASETGLSTIFIDLPTGL
ncbi:MAG: Nif3-like dinuclear metal center hexameric protein [Spirochaetes bacterium]|nr:Nif3-like dinuclear metal center hexameric protein [Spirochaetota bacterium]